MTDIARVLAEADPRVDAVYLFGSHAAGSVRPTSDVDFAVPLDPAAPLEDLLSVQYALKDVAEDRLGLPVDVVILRWDLSPPLLFEIFRRRPFFSPATRIGRIMWPAGHELNTETSCRDWNELGRSCSIVWRAARMPPSERQLELLKLRE